MASKTDLTFPANHIVIHHSEFAGGRIKGNNLKKLQRKYYCYFIAYTSCCLQLSKNIT
jgi:hypothetical protein